MKLTRYSVAFALESGGWETVSDFVAETVSDANKYAADHVAENYPGREDDWYVIDDNGRNVNICDQ